MNEIASLHRKPIVGRPLIQWVGKVLVCGFICVVVDGSPAAAQNPFGELLQAVGDVFGVADDQPVKALRPQRLAVLDLDKVEADVDFQNQFTIQLRKQLTPELHFVKKVCQPTAEQFTVIHKHGLTAVARLSKLYASLEKAGKPAYQWPQPREVLGKELFDIISQTLPKETAEAYQAEIDARNKLYRDASLGVMVTAIDKNLCLGPDQIDAIGQALESKWDDKWSRSVNMLVYIQYMDMPDNEVLKDHLTDAQKQVWSSRTRSGTIHFGWEQEICGQNWFGINADLPAFELPKGMAKPKAKDRKAVFEAIMLEAAEEAGVQVDVQSEVQVDVQSDEQVEGVEVEVQVVTDEEVAAYEAELEADAESENVPE